MVLKLLNHFLWITLYTAIFVVVPDFQIDQIDQIDVSSGAGYFFGLIVGSLFLPFSWTATDEE